MSPTPREARPWIERTFEEALEPDLPVCDPHHHLWDHPESRYLLPDLLADIQGTGEDTRHNITSTVFMECSSMYRAGGPRHLAPVGETEFVQGVAAMSASGGYGPTRVASGIVGFADLTLGEAVAEVLEAQMAASPNRFRGIRHASGWDPTPGIRNSHTNPPQHLLLDEQFRRGFALLEKHELTFDAWFYHTQLEEFIDLARAFPGTTIVLDHFGGPLGIGRFEGQQDAVFSEWSERITEVSACPNVHLKLGGINMKINGFNWHEREAPPGSDELLERSGRYYERCLELFGPERCMFESNFPVDRASCSYTVLWNAFKKLTAAMADADRALLFHDTAARVYRLGGQGAT